jgi:hypothetical protein
LKTLDKAASKASLQVLKSQEKMSLNYKQAGVDIDAGNERSR